jgi:hypothetical protein
MRLRSGAEVTPHFAPYNLNPSKRIFRPQPPPDNPISTAVSVEPLIQRAVAHEDLRFEQGEDDSEGLGVTTRPLTPLTEIESEDEAEAPHPGSGMPSCAKKQRRFEQGEDDSEGLGVTARPLTPLTEIESEDEAEAPHPGTGMPSCAKKRRRNAAANKRRSKKRVMMASSGHQPHTYAANPSTVAYHAEELTPLRVPADAESFPSSGSGSWVGLRKVGVKKVPWTVPDLVEVGFTFIEWDGR